MQEKPTNTGSLGSRAETTLFLLVSADGKITSGQSDSLDPDWDWTRVHGAKEGRIQYDRIEKTTDLHFLITGRIIAKLRPHDPGPMPEESSPVSGIIIDRKPWLTADDVRRTAARLKNLYIVTSNASHPAHDLQADIGNLTVIYYPDQIDFSDLFCKMKQQCGVDRITVQSGGTLHAVLVRAGLIDHLLLIVAPLLVGGKDTPSLVDGYSFQAENDLMGLKALKLTKCEVLKDSYLRLEYDVIQDTVVDPK